MDSCGKLLEAVNELVGAEDARQKLDAIEAVLPAARRYGAALTGELETLNALVRLAVEAPEKYKRVLDLIDDKRKEAGLLPLRDPVPRYDKVSYMREFMQQKRQRLRRAADIENLMRPEKDRLVGKSRIEFMDRQAAKWKEQRDRMIERARQAAGTERLSKEALDNLIRQFWANVDAELDALEDLAREERLKRGIVTPGISAGALHATLRQKEPRC